jgi:hypothetical protein
MKIYVVIGQTGEYSDRSEWVVAAYRSEEDAKAHVVAATANADAWHAFAQSCEGMDMEWSEQNERKKSANPLDPFFECDYTGTRYTYQPVDLWEKFVGSDRKN